MLCSTEKSRRTRLFYCRKVNDKSASNKPYLGSEYENVQADTISLEDYYKFIII